MFGPKPSRTRGGDVGDIQNLKKCPRQNPVIPRVGMVGIVGILVLEFMRGRFSLVRVAALVRWVIVRSDVMSPQRG